MTLETLRTYEPFWDKWYIEEKLGTGSYGDVYKIRREEYGQIYYAALKVISFPANKNEMLEISLASGGMEGTFTYYRNMLGGIVDEISLMERFKGRTNIVSYEDHDIVPHDGGKTPGYDIFIRMELLDDIRKIAISDSSFVRNNVQIRKLGMDICEALRICHNQNIIHRDIKPGNIFRSVDGDYKLGDFGIARRVEGDCMTMSIKGTFDYMSPEIYNRQHYDYRADIYSLGMVLYHILNGFRGPFVPTHGPLTAEQKEQALIRRMRGEELPRPIYAEESLWAAIKKACTYEMEERYQDIGEFYEALVEDVELEQEDVQQVWKEEEKVTASELLEEYTQIGVLEEVEAAEKQEEQKTPAKQEKPQQANSEQQEEIQVEEEKVSQIPLEEDKTVALMGFGQMDPLPGFEEEPLEEEPEEEPLEPMEDRVAPATYERDLPEEPRIGDTEEVPGISRGKLLAVSIATVAVLGVAAIGGVAWHQMNRDTEISNVKTPTKKVVPVVKKRVTPQLSGKITWEIKDPEDKTTYDCVFKNHTSLDRLILTGTFTDPATGQMVAGNLSMKDTGVVRKSGKYDYIFTPIDTDKYTAATGKIYLTALLKKSIKGVQGIRSVKNRSELYEVDLAGASLKDLNVIKGAKNLRILNAENNQITDITGLKGCKHINTLILAGNTNLAQAGTLTKLKNLEYVVLDGTAISQKVRAKVNRICESNR